MTEPLHTRCPICLTVFRVTEEQLGMRGGRVRCGRCRQVFDGRQRLESLVEPASGADASVGDAPAPAAAGLTLSAVALAVADASTDSGREAIELPRPESAAAAVLLPLAEAPGQMDSSKALGAGEAASERVVGEEAASERAVGEEAASERAVGEGAPALGAVAADAPEAAPAAAEVLETTADGPRTPDAGASGLVEPEVVAAISAAPEAAVPQAAEAEAAVAQSPVLPAAVADEAIPDVPAAGLGAAEAASSVAETSPGAGAASTDRAATGTSAASQLPLGGPLLPAAAGGDFVAGVPGTLPGEVPSAPAVGSLPWDVREPIGSKRLWAVLVPLLALVLAAQAGWQLRHEIAARLPALKPALVAACGWLGCRVEPPRGRDRVSIESSELHADAAHRGLLILTATLRNRADIAIAYPHLELTLTDLQDQPVARRVLAPAEYAGGTAQIDAGVPANGEVNVKLHIDASATQQQGYRLYLFYP